MTTTARDRARAALTDEILTAARAQPAEVGAAALSLRAVARELGMASSAVYRYFPSRDALLTRLIVNAYDDAGAAAEAADDPGRATRSRWVAVCLAVRGWALAHPHEYALLYGSPVPGYAAPTDTVPAAARVGVVLGRILGDAARAGQLPESAGRTTGTISAEVVAATGGAHPALDDGVLTRAVLAWSALYGVISFELFGHFGDSVTLVDTFAADAADALATLVGLPGSSGT